MEYSKIHPARQQCPHLGLLDDPTTALAYPSEWNVCYRARPASSVSIAHQQQACLDHRFEDCPVFQNALTMAMPSELRGTIKVRARNTARRQTSPRRGWRVVFLLVILLLATTWFTRDLWMSFFF